jgi:hypothetical protein
MGRPGFADLRTRTSTSGDVCLLDVPEVAVTCIGHGARTYLVKPADHEFLRLAPRDALAVRSILVERNDLTKP